MQRSGSLRVACRLWSARCAGLPFLASAPVALVLLAAGCGGSAKPPAVASIATTTASQGASTSPGSSPTPGGSGPSAGVASSGAAGGQAGGFAIATAGGSSGVAEAMKLAACMRSNGVPNFPDPNSQGVIQGSGIDPNSPAFEKAMQACRKSLPNGGAPTPAQQQQMKAQALAFSACMRSHGVPSFPDPTFSSGGRVTLKISAGQGLDPNSPQFQAAQTACQSLQPGAPLAAKSGVNAAKGG